MRRPSLDGWFAIACVIFVVGLFGGLLFRHSIVQNILVGVGCVAAFAALGLALVSRVQTEAREASRHNSRTGETGEFEIVIRGYEIAAVDRLIGRLRSSTLTVEELDAIVLPVRFRGYNRSQVDTILSGYRDQLTR